MDKSFREAVSRSVHRNVYFIYFDTSNKTLVLNPKVDYQMIKKLSFFANIDQSVALSLSSLQYSIIALDCYEQILEELIKNQNSFAFRMIMSFFFDFVCYF